jgi:glycosyltransferase involved in cell wall biosynthesis
MRIAIINWTRRRVGGVETYLDRIILELARANHQIAFLYESDEPLEREQIALPDGAPSWCVAELGAQPSLDALRAWKPDVIYSHKVEDVEFEADTLTISPSVYFAHDYQGMCISGTKTFKSPVVRPCDRRFGGGCLAHYYPHRCGGISPVTMFRLYRLQSKRLELLRRYHAVVTHSEHMLSELTKHGLSATNVFGLFQPDSDEVATGRNDQALSSNGSFLTRSHGNESPRRRGRLDWRLLFAGRMELLKGGQVFLDALPRVAAAIERPLHVTFAGDGSARAAWLQQAARLSERCPLLQIEFKGWIPPSQMDALLTDCDLLVVPSLWPEPFGLVGPEAGLRGVPVAAFSVGGISEWLVDGVNGHLAQGDPPTANGLADAIIRCLANTGNYENLRYGAAKMANQFSMKTHLTLLTAVLNRVVSQHPIPMPRRAGFA